MSAKSGSPTCMATCWAIAAVVGGLAAVLLWMLAGYSFMQGAFMGALAFVVVGVLLMVLMCRPLPPPVAAGSAGARATAPKADTAPPEPPRGPVPGGPATAAAPAADAVAQPAPEPEPAPAPMAAPAPMPEPAPAPMPEAAPPAPEPAPPPQAAAPAAMAAPAASGDAGTKPELLVAPRDGRGDDLKKIKGIGPGLEKSLNEQGVWHFAQIASWTEAELVWADQNLIKFKGRITRDDWVGQAKILAAGGETEFSKRSG